MERSQLLALVVGAGACGVVAAAYIHGPHGARRLEDEVDRAVSQSLALAGHSWARAEIDGQNVRLAGAAPTEKERDEAARAIETALGPGGPLFGAVASVDARAVEIVPAPAPRSQFRLRLIKRDGVVSAFGDSAGDAMNLLLRSAFRGNSGDIAAGLNNHAFEDAVDWIPAVGSAAEALALLDDGTLTIEGAMLTLDGAAASPQVADLARGFLTAVTPFFETTATIDPPAAEEPMSLEACAARLAEAAAASPVAFDPQSSRLPGATEAAIENLAAALQPCKAFGVVVEAHADQTGAPQANLTLSQRRAEAVAARLREEGVSSPIVAIGLGEASPLVAIERSDSDRAANRRLEIRLIQPTAATESE